MVIPQCQFKWYITKTDFSNGTSEFYVIFSNKESVVKKTSLQCVFMFMM